MKNKPAQFADDAWVVGVSADEQAHTGPHKEVDDADESDDLHLVSEYIKTDYNSKLVGGYY